MKSRSSLHHSFFRSLNQKYYSGLLSGLDNVDTIKKSYFYASSMDLKLTATFLKQPSYIFQQAGKDLPLSNSTNIDNYLITLDRNVSDWMEKNEFYDRELIFAKSSSDYTKERTVCLPSWWKVHGENIVIQPF